MTKIDKVKWTLYRIVEPTPKKLAKAKWVVFGAAALSTVLMFAGKPSPKYPRAQGD